MTRKFRVVSTYFHRFLKAVKTVLGHCKCVQGYLLMLITWKKYDFSQLDKPKKENRCALEIKHIFSILRGTVSSNFFVAELH